MHHVRASTGLQYNSTRSLKAFCFSKKCAFSSAAVADELPTRAVEDNFKLNGADDLHRHTRGGMGADPSGKLSPVYSRVKGDR